VIAHTGRIWEAASTDSSRPVLTAISFDAVKGTLTATDSYVMARVPCEVEEGDESGLIPSEALKTAKGRSLTIAGGKATLALPDGERTWNLLDGTAPNFDKILGDTPEIDAPFGLNADLLKKLALALNNGSLGPLALHPVHPRKAIRVEAGKDGEGVIMPVIVRTDGAPLPPKPADLTDDDKLITAIKAATAQLDKRRGKRKAAQAFREAIA
jgi:hypothetical protein